MKFELVIPAFNEKENLQCLIEKTVEAAISHGFDKNSFRLILVNNGSNDGSKELIEKLSKTHLGHWFQAIHLEKNQGYGGALHLGLYKTVAPYIGFTHGDLQCDPKDVFRAFEIIEKNRTSFSLVKGSRRNRPFKDRIFTAVFEILTKIIVGIDSSEINAQPKVFCRELNEKLENPPKGVTFDTYLIYQAQKSGYKLHEFPVLYPERLHGQSHWASSTITKIKTIQYAFGYLFQLAWTEGRARKLPRI